MKKIITTFLPLIFLFLFANIVYSENYSLIDEMVSASINGNESNVLEIKAKIEATAKPSRGDRTVARKLNDDALAALKESKYESAATILAAALETDKSDTEIASNLCYALIKSGKTNQADEPCRHSIMLNPNRSAAWENLGEVFANNNDLKSATAVLNITYLLSTNKDKTKEFFQKHLIDEQENQTLVAAATQALKNEGIKPVSGVQDRREEVTKFHQETKGKVAEQSIEAFPNSKAVVYYDQFNKPAATLEFDCLPETIPSVRECKKQTVIFDLFGEKLSYISKDIPLDSNGTFKYTIDSIGYIADTNQNIYERILYVPKTGIAFTASEGKFELLEKSPQGNLVSKFGLVSFAEYRKIIKSINPSVNVSYEAGKPGTDSNSYSLIEQTASHKCGIATVNIKAEHHPDNRDDVFNEISVSVNNDSSTIHLNTMSSAFSIACIQVKNNHSYIVYTNNCEGNKCSEYNYGIIEPNNLKILLKPLDWTKDDITDSNYKKATKILGMKFDVLNSIWHQNVFFPKS